MYKVLDLFCGAGGAAMGLHRAWSDAFIVGVDIVPQPRYPFRFVLADALRPPFDLREFDFIWASPKCQDYSVTKTITGKTYERQIQQVRELLMAAGKPYAIENVMGAKEDMRGTLKLCGTMFGLNVERHRLFETNPPVYFAPRTCTHLHGTAKRGEYDAGQHGYVTVAGHNFNLAVARRAMDISWMNHDEIAEAIPPAYSEYIARQIRPV